MGLGLQLGGRPLPSFPGLALEREEVAFTEKRRSRSAEGFGGKTMSFI